MDTTLLEHFSLILISSYYVGQNRRRRQFSSMNAKAVVFSTVTKGGRSVMQLLEVYFPSFYLVTAGAVTTVKKGTATEGTNTKNPNEAKKEKKPAVNLLLSRKTLKLPPQNRLVWFLPIHINISARNRLL